MRLGIQYSPLNLGLRAFWNLEEASGTRYDSGQNAINLTANNTPGNQASVDGQMGNGVALVRASNQYLSVASQSNLTFANFPLYITFWVYFNSFPASQTMYLISKNTSLATNANNEYAVEYVVASSALSFRVRAGSLNASVSVTPSFSTGTWYFVAAGFNNFNAGTNNLQISVNGAAPTYGVTASGSVLNASTFQFLIGSVNNTSGTELAANAFDGAIDGVGMWNRILTSDEISRLYGNGHGKQVPNL